MFGHRVVSTLDEYFSSNTVRMEEGGGGDPCLNISFVFIYLFIYLAINGISKGSVEMKFVRVTQDFLTVAFSIWYWSLHIYTVIQSRTIVYTPKRQNSVCFISIELPA